MTARFYLVLSGIYWAYQAIIMASKDTRMSKQGPAGKRKNTTLTVPQKI